MNIAWIIVHLDSTDTAFIEQAMSRRGLLVRTVRPYAGEPLPDTAQLTGDGSTDVVVCLGGPGSAYDTQAPPHLVDERYFLADAVERGAPVLGICLGSQLLSAALGGAAIPGESGLEAGYIEVLDVGSGHPLSRVLTGKYFSFHGDSFVPPPGATVLARTERYLQAWILGTAVAIQFHPEISVAGVRRIVAAEGPALARAGIDGADLVAAAELEQEGAAERCAHLLGSWLGHTLTSLPPPSRRSA